MGCILSVLEKIVALFLFGMFWPIMAICVLKIKSEAPGPSIFRQKRLGLRRKEFVLFKIRSMPIEGPRQPTLFGRWMRSRGLDELAQLINVIKGDMSLIGPRPIRQSGLDEFFRIHRDKKEELEEFFTWRFSTKPGITGSHQVVSDVRTDSLELLCQKDREPISIRGCLVSFLIPFLGKERFYQK